MNVPQTVVFDPVRIRAAVTMADAIAGVRDGFIGLSRGEFEMPVRTVLRGGAFLVMSAHHKPTASAMVKTLSLEFERRVPAIVGSVTWHDLSSSVHLLADAGEITALRTGAASGVATDLLAPPDATRLTIVGAGAQAADQVRAVCAVRSITHVTVSARREEAAAALVETLQSEFAGVQFRIETDPAHAVSDADVVCCATTSTTSLFPLEALRPEVHVNAIGAYRPTMRELPDELLADAGVVYVDDRSAVIEEAGEVIHAIASGAIGHGALVELGDALVRGESPHGGRTVFKSVGVAVQDWAIARLLAERSGDSATSD